MKTLPTKDLRPNPDNPRIIRDYQFQKLVKSLKDFPEMLEARPIVVDPDMVVLGGNMRLRACQEAGIKEVPVYIASWDEIKQKQFIVKDNIGYGEWDWDILGNTWESSQLADWGLIMPDWGNADDLHKINKGDENSEWVGMPEFDEKPDTYKIVIHFETPETREEWARQRDIEFLKKQNNAWSTNYPFTGRDDLKAYKYE